MSTGDWNTAFYISDTSFSIIEHYNKIKEIFAKYSSKKDYIVQDLISDLEKATLLWLGWALNLHDGNLVPDIAIKIIVDYLKSKGVQDPRGSGFKENMAALWSKLSPDNKGVFHYNMLAEERYSLCQWSGNWTIAVDSVQCVITRSVTCFFCPAQKSLVNKLKHFYSKIKQFST